MDKLKEFLQWNIDNPHNVSFKNIVGYEDREDTLKSMIQMIYMLERKFPILSTGVDIPWIIMELHNKQAWANHGQSLERLAERGGLGWGEALAVLEDRKYKYVDEDAARIQVLEIVADFYRQN